MSRWKFHREIRLMQVHRFTITLIAFARFSLEIRPYFNLNIHVVAKSKLLALIDGRKSGLLFYTVSATIMGVVYFALYNTPLALYLGI